MKTIYLAGLFVLLAWCSIGEVQAANSRMERYGPNSNFERSERFKRGPGLLKNLFRRSMPGSSRGQMIQDQRYFQDSAPRQTPPKPVLQRPEPEPVVGRRRSAQVTRISAVRISESRILGFATRNSRQEEMVAPPSNLTPVSGTTRRVVRTTAYTHTEADHQEYGRSNAIGTTLKASRSHNSAAADWSRFPVGTVFRILGDKTIYVIEDYGRALVGTDTIDIYRPNRSAMKQWGVRHVEIEILKYGCFDESRTILSGRLQHEHCLKMHRELARFQLAEAVAPASVGDQ